MLAWALHSVVGLVSLVCYILIVVKMFQAGQTGLGVLSIITFFCLIGLFITLIWGWVKAQDLKMVPLMAVYTASLLIGVILNIAMPIALPFAR